VFYCPQTVADPIPMCVCVCVYTHIPMLACMNPYMYVCLAPQKKKKQIAYPEHALAGQLPEETHEPGYEHRAQGVSIQLKRGQMPPQVRELNG
jgi:hypothetical protein